MRLMRGFLLGLALILFPLQALAYVGPGAGLSFAGSFLALLISVLVALGVILFWPVRLLIRRMRGQTGADGAGQETEAKGSDPS